MAAGAHRAGERSSEAEVDSTSSMNSSGGLAKLSIATLIASRRDKVVETEIIRRYFVIPHRPD